MNNQKTVHPHDFAKVVTNKMMDEYGVPKGTEPLDKVVQLYDHMAKVYDRNREWKFNLDFLRDFEDKEHQVRLYFDLRLFFDNNYKRISKVRVRVDFTTSAYRKGAQEALTLANFQREVSELAMNLQEDLNEMEFAC